MALLSDTTDFELQGSSITFNIGKSNYRRRHRHSYLEIFIMLSGEVAHHHCDKKFLLHKNAVAVIRPGEEHFFRKYKGYNHLRLNIAARMDEVKKITDALFPEFYDFLVTPGEPFFFYTDDYHASDVYESAHRLINILNSSHSRHFHGLLRSLLCKTLSLTYENVSVNHDTYPEWLNQFINMLKTPENLSLKVSEIASKSNYSYSHLCKLFQKHTGKTLLEYFKEIKLTYAQQLLEVTDYSCKVISEMIGYQSSGHFVKSFTKRFNKTPSEWRNSHRQLKY